MAVVTGLALVLAAALADPARLAPSDAGRAEAGELVRRLDDPSFAVRESATADLARLGRVAVDALDGARTSPSAEVRGRANLLYPAAVEAERAVRLASFLADQDLRYDHQIYGWKAFAAAAGNTPEAKRLFVAVAADGANLRLLEELHPAKNTPGLRQALAARREELYRQSVRSRLANGSRPQSFDAAAVAAVVAAEILTESEAPPNPTQEYQTAVYLSSPEGRQALQMEGDHGQPMGRLLREWVRTRRTTLGLAQAVAAANGAVIAGSRPGEPRPKSAFPVGLLTEVAGRHFARVDVPIAGRQSAWGALVRHKATDQLWSLGPQMADDADIIRPAAPSDNPLIKGRDMALAAALLLTDQRPTDYGFTDRSSLGALTYQTYTFRDDPADAKDGRKADVKRKEAFSRWAAWRQATRGSLGGALLAGAPDPLAPPDPASPE